MIWNCLLGEILYDLVGTAGIVCELEEPMIEPHMLYQLTYVSTVNFAGEFMYRCMTRSIS